MKFGKVEDSSALDLALPMDAPATAEVIKRANYKGKPNIYVGCAKWNKADLKNFYPRGTKDELAYYSSQFNSIEMNASYYRIFSKEQFTNWHEKVPNDFRFFPKCFQGISHWKRLNDAESYTEEFVDHILYLKENLGVPFLQMHNNFAPKKENMDALHHYLTKVWPKSIPLALELRHTDWYNDPEISQDLYTLL